MTYMNRSGQAVLEVVQFYKTAAFGPAGDHR